MKYMRICAAATVLMLLAGCANQTSEPDVSGTAESVQEQSSETESTAEETDAPESSEESEAASGAEESDSASSAETDEGWREAYAAVLRGTAAKRFSLVYIDDDDIPEMSLHFSQVGLAAPSDCPILYIYSNGEAKDMGSFSQEGNDQFGYVEHAGIVISSYFSAGAGYQEFLRLEDGELKSEHFIGIDMVSTDGEDVLYTIDGEDATTVDYDNLRADYFTPDCRITTGELDVTMDNIKQYVLGE